MDSQQGVTTTAATIKPSFFDQANFENYVFWKKEPIPPTPAEVKIMEGTLFQRTSEDWKSRFYILYDGRLAYYKMGETERHQERGYCLIQNMRLEMVNEPFLNALEREREDKFGFRLSSNRQAYEFYADTREELEKWMETLSRFCILTQYSYYFSNIKVIGQGRFAWVNLARRKSDNTEFAVKTFSKERLLSEDKAQASLINEINIMRKLDHESIIKFHNIYESDRNIYLVLELLNGGELFERIVQKGQYNETDACILMKKLLGALAHMHSKGIMHRDIKPENLILKDTENDWNVKIADFGLAQVINASEYLFRRCGTPGYVAPELLADQKYGAKVDVFSAGLILYILLTGGSPFYSECYEEILWKNQNCDISFHFSGHRISPTAVDLMKKMLAKDPQQRITADEALQHDWIVSGGTFLSPKSNNPVYLNLAQENLKAHGIHFKPQNVDNKDLLERAGHAPSPLITGKVDSIGDTQGFVFNSPEISIGAALANRQMYHAAASNTNNTNYKSPKGTKTPNRQFGRDGGQNGQYGKNQNNKGKNPRNMPNYMWNQVGPNEALSKSMNIPTNSTPKTAPIFPKGLNPELMNQKNGNVNVHQNFVKYLQMHSPQPKPRYSVNYGPQDPQQQPQFYQQQPQPQPQTQYQPFTQHQFFQQLAFQHQQQQQYQQQQQHLQAQTMQQSQPQMQTQPQTLLQQQFQYTQQQQYFPLQQQQQEQRQQVTKKAKDISQHLKQLQ